MAQGIIRTSSTVLLRGAMLLCLLLSAAVFIARLAGYELMAVQSDSMRPMMRKGDAVLLDRHTAEPKPGAVVSYVSQENPRLIITHRIVGVDMKRGIVSTKGDNTPLPDAPVPAWNLRGTVKRVLPAIGFALNVLKHPLGLLVVLYLPAIGIVYAEVRRLSAYYATGVRATKPLHYRLHPARR